VRTDKAQQGLLIEDEGEQGELYLAAAEGVLRRLKCMRVPSNRVKDARAVVHWLELRQGEKSPAVLLRIIRGIEERLQELGGEVDEELVKVVREIQEVFPGARLVGIEKGE
jgi:hypothetical protein